VSISDGSSGWDDYAPFYDWENARTLGRRDLPFWKRLIARAEGRVLELGCGTGRLLVPLARSGVDIVGIDRSEAMLAYARARLRRLRSPVHARVLRGDIRDLPFRSTRFSVVMAPYGMLQSLTTDADLAAVLHSAARVLKKGGLLGIDLVPDLPHWAEYSDRTTLRGRERDGSTIRLVESVRQDRRRGLTIFDQEYTRRLGRKVQARRFSLTFRTLSIPDMVDRLGTAGFTLDAALGGYNGAPLDLRADVWLLLARRC
jgi:ubiquinone/menaquinone biosynthesis C-methylase UbiE